MSTEQQHPGPDDVAPPVDRDEPRGRADEAGVHRDRRDEPDVSRDRRDEPDVHRDRWDGPDAAETRDGAGDRPRGGRLSEDRPENRRDGDGRDTGLVDPDRAREYRSRWEKVKGGFVDEPRRAVQDANALVGEVLDDVEAMFRHQREHLERELDDSDLSTEDMRLALGRYRTFFDRLLDL